MRVVCDRRVVETRVCRHPQSRVNSAITSNVPTKWTTSPGDPTQGAQSVRLESGYQAPGYRGTTRTRSRKGASLWMKRQDIDGSPDVSQYANDGIEPTHPSSRVKAIESVSGRPEGNRRTGGKRTTETTGRETATSTRR